jgi:hypothetical protein
MKHSSQLKTAQSLPFQGKSMVAGQQINPAAGQMLTPAQIAQLQAQNPQFMLNQAALLQAQQNQVMG